MTFADDQSPAPPFNGDETGKVLEPPDIVWQSPTTTERVVDTQSGFLVVVREIGTRLALSVKRRLGTPPTSAILLTPDESLSLSKILATPRDTTDGAIKARLYQLANEAKDNFTLDQFALNSHDSPAMSSSSLGEALVKRSPEASALSLRTANWEKLLGYKSESTSLREKLFRLSLGLCFVALTVFASTLFLKQQRSSKMLAEAGGIPVKVTKPKLEEIENFARSYVTRMLDFSPTSYQYSQIRAMSSMAPDLMQKYWQETNFPISANRLNELFHQQTVVVTKVTLKEPVQNSTQTADIFGRIVSAESATGKSVPLHLRLKIAEDNDKQLTVLEQTDLSGSNQ